MIWKVPLKGKFCVVLWYLACKILKHVSHPGAIKIVVQNIKTCIPSWCDKDCMVITVSFRPNSCLAYLITIIVSATLPNM